MKTLKLVALSLTLIFSAAALADVEEEHEMKIVVQGMSGDDSDRKLGIESHQHQYYQY